ncbi:MAG: hypothetical protein IPL61_31715 [Myxococcales bacterium]|nr:hypothetical protein [Myxococcales bacterium]
MKLTTLFATFALLTACASTELESPAPAQGIQVSVDPTSGLAVRVVSPEVSFVLEGHFGDTGASSTLRTLDGKVLTQIDMPFDVGAYGSDEMMAVVDAAAQRATVGDAATYEAAVEALVPYLTSLGGADQPDLDTHVALVLHQVLVLRAIAHAGTSEAAPCPEYLANPTTQAYHTAADHQAQIAMLPASAAGKLACAWYNPCCLHDYACITCGAGMGVAYELMCGWDCEVSMDCMGRCGGGCG